MKLLIVSCLLIALGMAQTGTGGAAAGGMDPYTWGMLDEVMDYGDAMFPEAEDWIQGMPFMNAGGAGGNAGGAAGGGMSGLMNQAMTGIPSYFGYGDIQDMMSDVYDNMKDGDIYDVMENLMPMAGMGIPGLDINSIMSGGMPNLGGIMNAVSPFLAMDGADYGDLGDLYKMGYDMYDNFEDYYKYGGAMGGMGGAPMLRKHKRHRLPSRLLKKSPTKKHLRHKREFPFMAMQNAGQSGSGTSRTFPWFFDAPDSEDIASFLMMGGNRNAIPPPLDGIDNEDLWMYHGTKWDPMAMFNKVTTQTNADGTQTQNNFNPWLWSLFSSLQKRHMQRKN